MSLSTQAGAVPSAELAAAQEQLLRLRQQVRRARAADATAAAAQPPRPPARCSPNHPGQSEGLTRALQVAAQRRQRAQARTAAASLAWLPSTPEPSSPHLPKRQPRDEGQDHVSLLPDIALAALRQGLVAPARIWLLLRHLDDDGRGWIAVEEARARLALQGAPLRVCGWRQLRNLFAQGDGIFWQRHEDGGQDGRLWLRSAARVAASLGIVRLQLQPVALPLHVLCEPIGTVRAHFFASYHSGRTKDHPISRQTMTDLTAVSRRSQHAYEQRAGVTAQQNWALGSYYNKKEAEEYAWRKGRAFFRFTDHKGKLGKNETDYLAWQLPNSYEGPHAPLSRGYRRRINRELADLFREGITGNGKKKEGSGEGPAGEQHVPHYYENGKAAAKGFNRAPHEEVYWRHRQQRSRFRVWFALSPQEEENRP